MTDLTKAEQRTANRARVIGSLAIFAFVASLVVGLFELVVGLYLFGFEGRVDWLKLARIEAVAVATLITAFIVIGIAMRIDPTKPVRETPTDD